MKRLPTDATSLHSKIVRRIHIAFMDGTHHATRTRVVTAHPAAQPTAATIDVVARLLRKGLL